MKMEGHLDLRFEGTGFLKMSHIFSFVDARHLN